MSTLSNNGDSDGDEATTVVEFNAAPPLEEEAVSLEDIAKLLKTLQNRTQTPRTFSMERKNRPTPGDQKERTSCNGRTSRT